MARKRFQYKGDKDAANGGLFYTVCDLKWRYSDVVRITPCSDAGGPDNCWWIDSLTVTLPDLVELGDPVVSSYGISEGDFGKLNKHQRDLFYIEAAIQYGKYDQDWSRMVCIGKSNHREFRPDINLNHRWQHIGNYVRQHVLPEAA